MRARPRAPLSRPKEDIPYTNSVEVVPAAPAAPYTKTTFEDFVARLRRHDPRGWIWMYTIDADRVVRRPTRALRQIDRVYAAVTRELLDAYGLRDVSVATIYNVGHVEFLGVYWTAEEAEANLGKRRPTIALNMYMARYVPVRAMHDTILHEIAHALMKSGDEHDHGDAWRSIAVAIGCSARIRAGYMDSRHIAENRYDSSIVFRCREGCFECYGKIVSETDADDGETRERSIVCDIVEDCDPTSGELMNPNARCAAHGLPLFLFPPRGSTTMAYVHRLLREHDEISTEISDARKTR